MIDICRVCLQEEDDNKKFFSISTRGIRNKRISSIIMECTTTIINKNDAFPKSICEICINNLNVAYEFKIQCEKSDIELKRRFLNIVHNNSSNSKDLQYEHNSDVETKIKVEIEDSYRIEDTKDSIAIYNFLDIEELSEASAESNSKKCDPNKQNMMNCKVEIEKLNSKKTRNNVNLSSIKKTKGRPLKDSGKKIRKPIHVCEHCGKSFKLNRSLKTHRTRHTGEKPYMCSNCGKLFHTPKELQQHSAVHSGDKRYKCMYCERRFADWGSRLKHERCHRGERPYKCDICPMDFTYSYVLKRHKLVHSGTKPFKCISCEQYFTTKNHLDRHNKKLHVILPE